MFTFDHHKWDVAFICIAFVAIMIGRFLNIYPLSLLLNIGRRPKIPVNFMNMLFFSGKYIWNTARKLRVYNNTHFIIPFYFSLYFP